MKRVFSVLLALALLAACDAPAEPPPAPESSSVSRSAGSVPASSQDAPPPVPETSIPQPEPESEPEPDPEPEHTREELTAMRLAALEGASPKGWSLEDYRREYPAVDLHQDEKAAELSFFLYRVGLGSSIMDINWSDKAAFASVEELDPQLLVWSCLNNATCFYFGREELRQYDNYLEGYECFLPYMENFDYGQGYFQEDVERQAFLYFGEKAKVEHQTVYPEGVYYEYAGVYSPAGVCIPPMPHPFVLSYAPLADGYEVIFASLFWGYDYNSDSDEGIIYQVPEREGEMTAAEAVDWYREHGAQARAILRRQEDGRLTMESLEILRRYKDIEEYLAEKKK